MPHIQHVGILNCRELISVKIKCCPMQCWLIGIWNVNYKSILQAHGRLKLGVGILGRKDSKLWECWLELWFMELLAVLRIWKVLGAMKCHSILYWLKFNFCCSLNFKRWNWIGLMEWNCNSFFVVICELYVTLSGNIGLKNMNRNWMD